MLSPNRRTRLLLSLVSQDSIFASSHSPDWIFVVSGVARLDFCCLWVAIVSGVAGLGLWGRRTRFLLFLDSQDSVFAVSVVAGLDFRRLWGRRTRFLKCPGHRTRSLKSTVAGLDF